MANTIDWGQGSKNNNIDWGQGAINNTIYWGSIYEFSPSGETNIEGTDGIAPINTIAPVISGTALVGNTLTSTTGTWSSDTGIVSYLYKWLRNGVEIVGATSSTYTLVSEDRLKTIRSQVAATDLDGTSAYVNSNSLLERTVENFKARVLADNGIFEAEACLNTIITNLNNI